MTTREWLAVRCCCTPQKVFGFLQVPSETVRSSKTFVVLDAQSTKHSLKLMPFSERTPFCPTAFPIDATEKISHVALPEREMAIYSDDRPIEFWRSIPGFVEAVKRDPVDQS